MSNRDRLIIFPSRANKVLIKNRTLAANRGLSMLKRKRDALEIKLNDLIAQRRTNVVNCNELFRDALFSFAKANFLETDFKPAPIIGSDRADAYMRMSYTKTIGLTLPTFESVLRKPESLPLTGLSRGGKQVDVIRDKFQELLRILVLMASLDYSIKLLKEAIRTNNMRLNGLEYVIIPRLINTSAYITNELDEMEREEFYRLKRSQAKQRRIKQKAEEAKKKLKKQEEGGVESEIETDGEWEDEVPQVDASTSIDFNNFKVPIYQKKQLTNMTQTIITGHFPDSDEVISPTDSIVSGNIPVTGKRSKYGVSIIPPRPADKIGYPDTSQDDFHTPMAYPLEKITSSSIAQTVITGHFPESDEVISPTDSVISGSKPAIAKRSKYQLLIPRPTGKNKKDGPSSSKNEKETDSLDSYHSNTDCEGAECEK